MQSPQSLQDLVWYGFNGLWLLVVSLITIIINGIRQELRELRKDLGKERKWSQWLLNVVMAQRNFCSMMHPKEKMPDIPPAPED